MGKTIHLDKKCQKRCFTSFFAIYVTKLFELMVVYISSDVTCKWTVTFITWKSWSKPKYSFIESFKCFYNHQDEGCFFIKRVSYQSWNVASTLQLAPIFHLLQLIAMENYSEKCSQIQMLLKDINKARRKLNILVSSVSSIFYAIPPRWFSW